MNIIKIISVIKGMTFSLQAHGDTAFRLLTEIIKKAGKMYSGTVIGSGENEFKLELYKAYGYSKLKSLTRRFTLEDKAVTVSDTFFVFL